MAQTTPKTVLESLANAGHTMAPLAVSIAGSGIVVSALTTTGLVVALGDCACGRGVLGSPSELSGAVEGVLRVDVRITGCPPTPDAIGEGLLEALALSDAGRKRA